MKFNKENIKQITLLFIAFSLILVGYLNYSYNTSKSLEVAANTNEVNLGDVQLVNSKPINESNTIVVAGDIVSNDELNDNTINDTQKNFVSDVEQRIREDNYFKETKIERDRMYSEMLETYQKIIDSPETPNDQKSIATQEVSNITNIKNGIMISENLIKNKGFEDVVILVNNGKVSVVVKYSKLTKEQISQIQNIIERELNVKVQNISISSK